MMLKLAPIGLSGTVISVPKVTCSKWPPARPDPPLSSKGALSYNSFNIPLG
jgi:hypothetical protein